MQRSQPTPKGAPFYNAVASVTVGGSLMVYFQATEVPENNTGLKRVRKCSPRPEISQLNYQVIACE
jgi:hypothetical protein